MKTSTEAVEPKRFLVAPGARGQGGFGSTGA